MAIPSVGRAAHSAASSDVRSARRESSTTSETRPHTCASAAARRRPDASHSKARAGPRSRLRKYVPPESGTRPTLRSEEHTSELQSLTNLVCRLLLEKKKNKNDRQIVGTDGIA